MNNHTPTLKDQATSSVRSKKGSLPQLSRDLGLDYNWIRKFADGAIKDPGVSKIERILKYAKREEILMNIK